MIKNIPKSIGYWLNNVFNFTDHYYVKILSDPEQISGGYYRYKTKVIGKERKIFNILIGRYKFDKGTFVRINKK